MMVSLLAAMMIGVFAAAFVPFFAVVRLFASIRFLTVVWFFAFVRLFAFVGFLAFVGLAFIRFFMVVMLLAFMMFFASVRLYPPPKIPNVMRTPLFSRAGGFFGFPV